MSNQMCVLNTETSSDNLLHSSCRESPNNYSATTATGATKTKLTNRITEK